MDNRIKLDKEIEKKPEVKDIKQINCNRIYRLLSKNNGLSRQDICKQLHLSLPTVNQNLSELLAEGLITDSESIGNTGGRRAQAFSIVEDARLAIGMEVSQNHLTIVVVDLLGEVRYSKRIQCDFTLVTDYYEAVGELIEETVQEAGLTEKNILGVGIAVSDSRQERNGPLVDDAEEMKSRVSLPVQLFHAVAAAGFAEMQNHPEMEDAFYLMLSNSVEGAVYIDGRQYYGRNGCSGCVGHMTLMPEGRQCACGRYGCVEAYCAASALTKGSLQMFFQQLQAGEPEAREQFQVYLKHLAMLLRNLQLLFDVPIIIGGYIGNFIEPYLPELRKQIGITSFAKEKERGLYSCTYRKEASAVGAAMCFIKDFVDAI